MKNLYLLPLFTFLLGQSALLAQTNPSAFDLGSGDYSFNSWAPTSPAGTYPANMVFHYTTDPTGANYNPLANGTTDFNCPYNLTGRNRIVGLDADGVKFVSVNNAQFANCTDGSTAGGRYVGAAVVSLNTTGRTAISVSYTGGTVVQADGNGDLSVARVWAIRLQYRVGTEGEFTDVSGPVQYVSGLTGESATVSGTLPTACDNQANVQVRFLYFQTAAGQGSRPEMRLDEISITSAEDVTIGVNNASSASVLSAFPNPSASGRFKLSSKVSGGVYDIIGQKVLDLKNTDVIDLSAKHGGHYFLKTDRGSVIRLMK